MNCLSVLSLLLTSQVYISSVDGTTYCLDSYECSGDDTTDDYIYCNGNYGCYDAVMEASSYLYCQGNYGCLYATLAASSSLYCGGFYGCYDSEIGNAGNYFYSYGQFGSAYSYIIGNSDEDANAYMYGAYSGAYSAFSKFDDFYAFGAYSMYSSTVDSEDVDTLNLYMYGYYAGYDMVLYCQAGSTCNVYCDSSYNGCSNMEIIYYPGSILNVDCDSGCSSCPDTYNITVATYKTILDERLWPENKKLEMVEKRQAISDKSHEFIAAYGQEKGLEKFSEWNGKQIESETSKIEALHALDSIKNIPVSQTSSNSMYSVFGNGYLNWQVLEIFVGVLIIFALGSIAGRCTGAKKDYQLYESSANYQSIAA